MKHADLHHPGICLKCPNQVCRLISTIILCCWNPEVCWLASPMGLIKMLHSSMLTCITHESCWLISPRYMFELPKPCMSTYIINYPFVVEIHVCSISYDAYWLTSPRDIFVLPEPSMSTYITHQHHLVGKNLKYVDINHPLLQLCHLSMAYLHHWVHIKMTLKLIIIQITDTWWDTLCHTCMNFADTWIRILTWHSWYK